jgi:hypothetical protein
MTVKEISYEKHKLGMWAELQARVYTNYYCSNNYNFHLGTFLSVFQTLSTVCGYY